MAVWVGGFGSLGNQSYVQNRFKKGVSFVLGLFFVYLIQSI